MTLRSGFNVEQNGLLEAHFFTGYGVSKAQLPGVQAQPFELPASARNVTDDRITDRSTVDAQLVRSDGNRFQSQKSRIAVPLPHPKPCFRMLAAILQVPPLLIGEASDGGYYRSFIFFDYAGHQRKIFFLNILPLKQPGEFTVNRD